MDPSRELPKKRYQKKSKKGQRRQQAGPYISSPSNAAAPKMSDRSPEGVGRPGTPRVCGCQFEVQKESREEFFASRVGGSTSTGWLAM